MVAGSALAIQLFAGFVVPLGDGDEPGLGHLAAAGLDNVSSSPWPLASALVAAVAAGTALYWSVGALSRVGRTMPRADDGDGGWSVANPDGALLGTDPEESRAEPTASTPPRVTLADDTQPHTAPPGSEPATPTEPLVVADGTAPTDDPAAPEGPELFPASDITESPVIPSVPEPPQPPGLDGDQPLERSVDLEASIDIRDGITVDSVQDSPAPDADAAPDDDVPGRSSIEDEASQTVELRPADLRRAGVQPEPD